MLTPAFIQWSQLGIHIVGFATFAALAALIALRSREIVPLLASAMLVTVGASLFAPLAGLQGPLGRLAVVVGEMVPGRIPGLWVSLSGILLIAFLLTATGGGLGNLAKLILVGLALVGLVSAISPGWLLDPARLGQPWKQIWTAGVPAGALAAATWRLRSQTVERRRQMRPVLVALALILAAYLVLVLLRPGLSSDAFGLVLATPRLQALYEINTLLLITAAVFALPFSIVLAVVRYRLFEIDLLVNRALVYGAMTGVVTVVFLAVTLVTAVVAGGVLGQGVSGAQVGQAAAIAGVITGMVMAGGLQPLRRRLQRSVDRYFYREKFDAEQALDGFATRLAEVFDVAVLKAEAGGPRQSDAPAGMDRYLSRLCDSSGAGRRPNMPDRPWSGFCREWRSQLRSAPVRRSSGSWASAGGCRGRPIGASNFSFSGRWPSGWDRHYGWSACSNARRPIERTASATSRN